MKRWIALFLAAVMVFGLAACAKEQEPAIDLSGKLDNLQNTPEKPEETKPEKPEKTDKPEKTEKPAPEDPEPSQGLDAYENPPDHPHEGKDLTVFDGVYRAKLAHEEDEETWLEITGYNDFILLEYNGMMDDSVYRYWAEEFWPADGWYTDTEENTVSGLSQTFTSMAQYENYEGLPQNRCITLTDDGVVLNYDDSDAEYYVRDNSFAGCHTDPADMRERLGEAVHLDFDYQYDSRDVLGSWGIWTGWEAYCLTFYDNGTFHFYRKMPNKPIEVYNGAYGFGTNSGNLELTAERVGFGGYPYYANWEWSIDEYGNLNVYDFDQGLLDGEYYFWPVEEDFFTVMDAHTALGYIFEMHHDMSSYTDSYGTEYSYYYSLPNFYGSNHRDLEKINRMINAFYDPIIQSEYLAMDAGEFLTYDLVDWQSAVYNGVLFLHIYAYTYDWEEHDVFYIDVETMEELDPEDVLERLGMEEDYFLDTIRKRSEEVFVNYFSDLPEEHREEYGYYDCLKQTVSDEFVNVDLPIFVDRNGRITVYLKIASMAGSGIMWMEDCPFEPIYVEEAVG